MELLQLARDGHLEQIIEVTSGRRHIQVFRPTAEGRTWAESRSDNFGFLTNPESALFDD